MTSHIDFGTPSEDVPDAILESTGGFAPFDVVVEGRDGRWTRTVGDAVAAAQPVRGLRNARPRRRTDQPVRRRTRSLLAGLDLVAIGLGIALGIAAVAAVGGAGTVQPGTQLGLWTLAYTPLYGLAFAAYGLYGRDQRRLFATNFPDLLYLAHALLAAGAATLGVSHVLRRYLEVHPTLSLTGVVYITLPVLLTVPVVRVLGGMAVRRRGVVRSRVIILGSGTVADSVASRLAGMPDVQLLGCVDDPGPYGDKVRGVTSIGRLGAACDLPRLCDGLDADRVVVAFSPTDELALMETLRQLPPTVQVSVVPRLFDLLTWRSHVDEIHGLTVIDVAPPALSAGSRAVKRTFDLVVASGLLVLTLPGWIAIAVVIKVSSPGPVFFRQERAGRRSGLFKIYKFRTMRQGADEEKATLQAENEVDGPLFKMRHDPRTTRIGRLLRATSLDELPQLLNVLKGEMSLVGPRPFVPDEAGRIDGWAARRFDVRPGMTGLWQVSGRNDLPFEDLQRLDYAYVASWSPWWDLRIIWQTPATVLHRRGAY